MSDASPGHDRWRSTLRRGDPLGEGEPAPADVRRLRARVLQAARERTTPPAEAPWWVARRNPAMLAAACAALIALVAVSAWLVRPGLRSEPVETARHAAPAPAPAAAPAGPEASRGATIARAESARPRTVDVPAGAPRRPSVSVGAEEDDARPRQLQFVTAGGTRIVWVLNPKFTLAPGAPQQEDPRWSGN